METILRLLGLTGAFGIGVVAAAVILAICERCRNRRVQRLLDNAKIGQTVHQVFESVQHTGKGSGEVATDGQFHSQQSVPDSGDKIASPSREPLTQD